MAVAAAEARAVEEKALIACAFWSHTLFLLIQSLRR
jgi:hypothetical protein